MRETATRYCAVLVCDGVPAKEGSAAADCITDEFAHRPWHWNVVCTWDGRSLVLKAENDFDADGLALIDEFSDVISVCCAKPFDGDIRIVSITEV